MRHIQVSFSKQESPHVDRSCELERWDSKYYNNCTVFYFFLQHTHYPQYAGPGAAGRSLRGPFGDALLEFDNTIGNLLTTLEKTGVINNTLVFFTSDNGLGFCPCFVFICKWIYGLYVFVVISNLPPHYLWYCSLSFLRSKVKLHYVFALFYIWFIAFLWCCMCCLLPNGVLFLSLRVGLNWCVCPVEVTLALWNVEKAPHMRGAWESQPSPSGPGPSDQVSTP